MINKLVDWLFKWEALRAAIYAEVDWDNSITRILQDPESMQTASAMWCEDDGWRAWTIKDNGNYYFHDIPEKSLSDIFEIISPMEEGLV